MRGNAGGRDSPEAGVAAAGARPGRDVGVRLWAVTDRRMVPDLDLPARLDALCRRGVRGVMLREKDLDEEALLALALECRPVFDRHGVVWLVNGAAGVARRAEASGVHLTGAQDVAPAREVLGTGALVGKSVHDPEEAAAAARAGADLLLFGPVFATPAKERYGPPQGLDRLRAACGAVRVPVFAVGGVVPGNARKCLEAGARGVAAISSLMRSESPAETVAEYERELSGL